MDKIQCVHTCFKSSVCVCVCLFVPETSASACVCVWWSNEVTILLTQEFQNDTPYYWQDNAASAFNLTHTSRHLWSLSTVFDWHSVPHQSVPVKSSIQTWSWFLRSWCWFLIKFPFEYFHFSQSLYLMFFCNAALYWYGSNILLIFFLQQ